MHTATHSAPPSASAPSRGTARQWFVLQPEDGWLTYLLLAVVVYITVISIQSVSPAWAPGMQILTFTTGLGLLLGYAAAQQRALPRQLVHVLVVVVGVLFALTQTADAVNNGDRLGLLTHLKLWFERAILRGQSSTDNTVFLLLLGVLTYLLAYLSVWMLVHTRRAWLAVLANGVVLLINLNWAAPEQFFFVVLFVLATLLLLVRFTLAENMRVWRARGLRHSPDLAWDFMQSGVLFAVLVLLAANLLPAGSANTAIQDAWNSPDSPLQAVASRWQIIFAGLNGRNGQGNGGVGFFSPTLRLVGTVDLPNVPILHYTTTDDPTQYLVTQTFDQYDGTATWSASPARLTTFDAGATLPGSTDLTKTYTYRITFDRVPPGGQEYLFAPGVEAAGFSVPSKAQIGANTNMATTWLAQPRLQARQTYDARGYVPSATEEQLRAVAYPAQADGKSPASTYPKYVLTDYLGSDNVLDSIRQTAQEAVRGTTTMYDAALHLEDYLRTFTYSVRNPEPPANTDAVAWFLDRKIGFCTYFASAMAVMGRTLGMPTRIASGFTRGTFDAKTQTFVVKGTDAHTWTQIYFAGYGWVNFEPSASFDKFARQVSTAAAPTVGAGGAAGGATPTPRANVDRAPNDPTFNQTGAATGLNSPLVRAGLGASGVLLLALLALALFLLWWRYLYRGLSPVANAFARVTRLGTWAGAPPRGMQTPHEYADHLGQVLPQRRTALARLSALYARERWGGGLPPEDTSDLTVLYEQIRTSVTPVIARRARHLPRAAVQRLARLRRARRPARR